MEIVGCALSSVAIGDPLIKAIRGLRKLYYATNEAPEILNRLEHDGNTIEAYLKFVNDAIAESRNQYPESFIAWFEDEKKLLKRSTTQIEEYAKTLKQRLQTSPLVSGVQYALDVTEISKVQEQVARSMLTIGHMITICEHRSIASRTAALGAKESRLLQAQTASSIAECHGDSLESYNVSSSLDGSGGVTTYEDVLKKSRPYIRIAVDELFATSHGDDGLLSSVAAQGDRQQSLSGLSIQDDDSRHAPAVASGSGLAARKHSSDCGTQSPIDYPPTSLSHQQLLTLSTQSSSSEGLRNWSIADELTGVSTPLTTETGWSSEMRETSRHRRYLPLRVEIEGVGKRTMDLDRLGVGEIYTHVQTAISTLRDDILVSAGTNAVDILVVSREQGIVPYKKTGECESESTIRLNAGYLAGAVLDLDAGFFARLEIFATFSLAPSEDKEQQMACSILGCQKTGADRRRPRASAPFPTVETVLKMQHPTASKWAMRVSHTRSHNSSSWCLIWLAKDFMIPESQWPANSLMPDGPDWREKELVARGGSSDVYKVMLSQPHQFCFPHPGPFALKALRPGQENTFIRELKAHMRLASTDNPHIITLLMAYEQAGRLHFLFPWAEGTLATFFQSRVISPSSQAVFWLVSQFTGIVRALQSIHFMSEKTSAGGVDVLWQGWHGDIKPENILWFQPSSSVDMTADHGTLVLTDFGLSGFRQDIFGLTQTKVPRRDRGRTLAYSPPDQEHSPSYDIFSLGCVLLEIAAWIVGGQEGSRRFLSARFEDGNGRSYITHSDNSLRLHPSLSNPRSTIESLALKRSQGPEGAPFVESGLKLFLDRYCDTVERCLSLCAANRPSAGDVVEFLEMMIASLEPTIMTSTLEGIERPTHPFETTGRGASQVILRVCPEIASDRPIRATDNLPRPFLISRTSGNSRQTLELHGPTAMRTVELTGSPPTHTTSTGTMGPTKPNTSPKLGSAYQTTVSAQPGPAIPQTWNFTDQDDPCPSSQFLDHPSSARFSQDWDLQNGLPKIVQDINVGVGCSVPGAVLTAGEIASATGFDNPGSPGKSAVRAANSGFFTVSSIFGSALHDHPMESDPMFTWNSLPSPAQLHGPGFPKWAPPHEWQTFNPASFLAPNLIAATPFPSPLSPANSIADQPTWAAYKAGNDIAAERPKQLGLQATSRSISGSRSFIRRKLQFLKASSPPEISCWRCKSARKKCDGGTPCRYCATHPLPGNSAIPCRRGPVCDAAAEIPFLCHMPQRDSTPEATVLLPPHLQLAKDFLRHQGRIPDRTMREHDAGCNCSLLCRVLNTEPPYIKFYGDFRDIGLILPARIPYDSILARIVWGLEDSPEVAQLTGVRSAEELVALLEAASLCETENCAGYERRGLLVYNSMGCLMHCIEALRLSVRGLLDTDPHAHCAQASTCISPAFRDLTRYALRYAEALNIVLFHKGRSRDWLPAFYSLCIQQYVRRGFISLEERLRPFEPSTGGIDGRNTPHQSASYLQEAASLFGTISVQNDSKLAKQIRDLRPAPSVYLRPMPDPPRAPGGSSSAEVAWQTWRGQGVDEFVQGIFQIPINDSPIRTQPQSSPGAGSDSDSDQTIMLPLSATATATGATIEVHKDVGNADGDCTALNTPAPSILSVWSNTTVDGGSAADTSTFYERSLASSSASYVGSPAFSTSSVWPIDCDDSTVEENFFGSLE